MKILKDGHLIFDQKQQWEQAIKKYLLTPSIAVAALNLSPESFNTPDGLETFGFIFENLCIRDLSVYTSSLKWKIRYHDDAGIEIDCVVHLRDGRYALIECKLGKTNIEKSAQNLIKISKLIEKMIK